MVKYLPQQINVLIVAFFLGAWKRDSKDENFIDLLFEKEKISYEILLEVSNIYPNLVQLKQNSYWQVGDRSAVWDVISSSIQAWHIDQFSNIAVRVLKEEDPKLEWAPDQHFKAEICGKTPQYSDHLRRGLSETIAWIGVHHDSLTGASIKNAQAIASKIIGEILNDASWQLWGSLNILLPNLAEADPETFLSAIESALKQVECPFIRLFEQEGDTLTGSNYMTGLLWGLEVLAWDENYLSRVVLILAQLSTVDKGGSWGNRPINSIRDILLPWHPQTFATLENKIEAINQVIQQFPDIAWSVLKSLMPNSRQTTSGTYKPKWRNKLSEEWSPKVSNADYWKQVTRHSEMALSMAKGNIDRVMDLVQALDSMPGQTFKEFLDYLSLQYSKELKEEESSRIWSNLSTYIEKKRSVVDKKSDLPPEILEKSEDVVRKLKPKDVFFLHQRLFNSSDFELYDDNVDWDAKREKLREERKKSINEVLDKHNLKGVVRFYKIVENVSEVGWALGSIFCTECDNSLVPSQLIPDDRKDELFICNFVASRFDNFKMNWVKNLNYGDWSLEQRTKFLTYLPFTKEIWDLVPEWIPENEVLYWKQVNVNPYVAGLEVKNILDKLIDAGKPIAAIECLDYCLYRNSEIDLRVSFKALKEALVSDEKPNSMQTYSITNIISHLQKNAGQNEQELCDLEWNYLRLLRDHSKVRPEFLNERLARDPEYFCKIISYAYRPENSDLNKEFNDEEKRSGSLAWRLLDQWDRLPGLSKDGIFKPSDFNDWIQEVREIAQKSGHWIMSQQIIGQVLLNYKTNYDSEKGSIDPVILKFLDDEASEHVRKGYRLGVYNGRGAYWVDPSGEEELKLAEYWNKEFERVTQLGFKNVATMFQDIVKSYEDEAVRVRSDELD